MVYRDLCGSAEVGDVADPAIGWAERGTHGAVATGEDDGDEGPMHRPPGGEQMTQGLSTVLDVYLHENGPLPLLTPAQEIDLAQRAEQGEAEAAMALAQSNLRLVVRVARHYQNRGLPLEDLIAEYDDRDWRIRETRRRLRRFDEQLSRLGDE